MGVKPSLGLFWADLVLCIFCCITVSPSGIMLLINVFLMLF